MFCATDDGIFAVARIEISPIDPVFGQVVIHPAHELILVLAIREIVVT